MQQAEKKVRAGRCILICAGDLTVSQVTRTEEDMVIAVDGGLGYCSVLELEPDIIVGDFDSMSQGEKLAVEKLCVQIPDRIVRLPVEKDDTDTLAAIKIGLEAGYRQFLLYGATGGRVSHTIANLQCLLYLKKHDAVGYIMDGTGMMLVICDEAVHFRKELRGTLSLFSMGDKAEKVTIEGMKYCLEAATVTNDYPIGISNEFVGKEAMIMIENGSMACIIEYEQEA